MTMFSVYAHGTFYGHFEADTAEDAVQLAADEFGTIDVGEDRASTEGMTAEPLTGDTATEIETLDDILAAQRD